MATATLDSALYEGTIGHHRVDPDHHFTYPELLAYLDLSELPQALDAHPLWSARHWAPVCFRRADYHGDPSLPLDTAVRDTIEDRTGHRPTGPIRMLAHLRTWGWAFNPIAFYFAFDPTGTRVETVLGEVTNTPWHERHAYVLPVADGEDPAVDPIRFHKALHVSPFMDMDLDHALTWTPPGAESLRIRMTDHREDERTFIADLRLRRISLDRRSMGAVLRRHVLPTHRVSAGIYWQALKLKLKGAPFRRHPFRHPADPTGANTSHTQCRRTP